MLFRPDSKPFVVGTYHMPCMFKVPSVMMIHCALSAQHIHKYASNDPYLLVGDFNIKPGAPPPIPSHPACLAMPCHALPCLAMPCHALPCRALPCLALPCLALPCLALPCLALQCEATPCSESNCYPVFAKLFYHRFIHV